MNEVPRYLLKNNRHDSLTILQGMNSNKNWLIESARIPIQLRMLLVPSTGTLVRGLEYIRGFLEKDNATERDKIAVRG